jgi:hypothetical protein
MNSGRNLCLLSLLACLLSSPVLKAQAVADLQAPFKVSFKLTANTPTVGRSVSDGSAYETLAKFVSVTVTQRDLLASLIEDGKIAPPLTGWSIVGRVRSDEALGLEHRLFAVKKGQPDFALDENEADETDELTFESGFLISSFKERYHSAGFYTGSGTIRFNVIGSFNADGEPMYLSGNVSFPYAYKEAALDLTKVTIPVPGAVSLELTGGAVLQDDYLGEFSVLIEGTLGFGAHKIIAVHSADSEL